MSTVKCPYCGFEQYVDHEDGYGYEEDETYSQLCPCCDKRFGYLTHIHFSYDVWQAPCLDNGEHQYELTNTYPKFASKMRCKVCGHERDATLEEREKYKLGTAEEYLESLKQ